MGKRARSVCLKLRMRHVDDIVVVADAAFLKCLNRTCYRAEQGLESHAEAAAELAADGSAVDGADELAGGIHRKRCDIRVKPAPRVLLKQILFDIGKVECRYSASCSFKYWPTARRA